MFHAISDQLARLGLTLNNPSELRSSVVQYLRNNPLASDGTHLRYFLPSLGGLLAQNVSRDWITLWDLVNMLNIDIALVSSIGEGGLRVTSPDDTSISNPIQPDGTSESRGRGTLPQSDNVTTVSAGKGEDLVAYMKNNYSKGNVSEEICPKFCQKFKCLSAVIYEDESGMMQYYPDDCYACDECSKDEDWYSY